MPRVLAMAPHPQHLAGRQAASAGQDDDGTAARASYAVVSLLCMLVMASLFGLIHMCRSPIGVLTAP